MRALWITGLSLALDQASKWLVVDSMRLGESIPVLGSFFKLTYILNPGAVFGMKVGGAGVHLALAGAALIFVFGLLWKLPRTEKLRSVALALVLGGAIGNVIDRISLGEVIDFLDFGLGSVRWYIFNLADVWVTTGTGLLILSYSLQKEDAETSNGNGGASRA